MDRQLFEGVREREVRLRMLEETYRSAATLIREHGWEDAWGEDAWLIIFAHGLAYLRAEQERAGHAAAGSSGGQDPDDLRRRLMECEGKYAVMKFHAFTLGRDKRALEMQATGLRGEHELAMERLTRFREDEERLRAELARLKAENAALRAQLEADGESEPQPAGRTKGRWWAIWARRSSGQGRASSPR